MLPRLQAKGTDERYRQCLDRLVTELQEAAGAGPPALDLRRLGQPGTAGQGPARHFGNQEEITGKLATSSANKKGLGAPDPGVITPLEGPKNWQHFWQHLVRIYPPKGHSSSQSKL